MASSGLAGIWGGPFVAATWWDLGEWLVTGWELLSGGHRRFRLSPIYGGGKSSKLSGRDGIHIFSLSSFCSSRGFVFWLICFYFQENAFFLAGINSASKRHKGIFDSKRGEQFLCSECPLVVQQGIGVAVQFHRRH